METYGTINGLVQIGSTTTQTTSVLQHGTINGNLIVSVDVDVPP